jgi:hypothetical protein
LPSLQPLFSLYSPFVHSLFILYSSSTNHHFTPYSPYIHPLNTLYSSSTQPIFTFFSPSMHPLFNTYSSYVPTPLLKTPTHIPKIARFSMHPFFIVFQPSLHPLFSLYSASTHHLFIPYSSSIHPLYTLCPSSIHPLSTLYSSSIHPLSSTYPTSLHTPLLKTHTKNHHPPKLVYSSTPNITQMGYCWMWLQRGRCTYLEGGNCSYYGQQLLHPGVIPGRNILATTATSASYLRRSIQHKQCIREPCIITGCPYFHQLITITTLSTQIQTDRISKNQSPLPVTLLLAQASVEYEEKNEDAYALHVEAKRPILNPDLTGCQFWQTQGHCNCENKCSSGRTTLPSQPRHKSTVCRNNLKGRCNKGASCRYDHTLPPCNLLNEKGQCSVLLQGKECRYTHPQPEVYPSPTNLGSNLTHTDPLIPPNPPATRWHSSHSTFPTHPSSTLQPPGFLQPPQILIYTPHSKSSRRNNPCEHNIHNRSKKQKLMCRVMHNLRFRFPWFLTYPLTPTQLCLLTHNLPQTLVSVLSLPRLTPNTYYCFGVSINLPQTLTTVWGKLTHTGGNPAQLH